MEYLNKSMIFFLFILLSYGINIFTVFRIYNRTDKSLRVQLYYHSAVLGTRQTIKAGGVARFPFLGKKIRLCPTKVMVYERSIRDQKEAKILIRKSGRLVSGDTKWASYNQLNGCSHTYFELKINPASGEIYAFFF